MVAVDTVAADTVAAVTSVVVTSVEAIWDMSEVDTLGTPVISDMWVDPIMVAAITTGVMDILGSELGWEDTEAMAMVSDIRA